MRTTLTIDDDVLLAAKQRAATQGTSVGQALSAMAREGLARQRGDEVRNGVALIRGAVNPVTCEMVQSLIEEGP